MRPVGIPEISSIRNIAVLLGAVVIAAVACADPPNPSSSPAPTPTTTADPTAIIEQPRPSEINTADSSDSALPEGWRRVQVREGYVGRDFENPLAGFTIDLPPGWDALESWPSNDAASGWISGADDGSSEYAPVLNFDIGRDFGHFSESLDDDPELIVTRETVADQDAVLYLPRQTPGDDGPWVGIYYERIPGGPDNERVPPLHIRGASRGFTDIELLARVLKSVRYAEIESLPELPEIDVEPRLEWERIPARDDHNTFTVMTPPGWTTETRQGTDTMVGSISGDGIELRYDFGGFAGNPYGPGWTIADRRYSPHMIWEEQRGDTHFSFARPTSPEPDGDSMTSVLVHRRASPGKPGLKVSIHARGLDGDEQDTVLAILSSLQFEPSAPGPK